jgi:Cdc6-like AAA superfamily ATPase
VQPSALPAQSAGRERYIELSESEMSALMVALRDHAFDPRPIPDLYQFTHVAFDELLGGVEVEARLVTAAAGLRRVALIGKSGTGKTSVVRYALAENVENIAPIWLQVAPEDPETVSDLTKFGRYLVETIVHFASVERDILSRKDAQQSLGEAAGERYIKAGRRTTTHAGVAMRTPWMNGDLARELAESAPEINMGTSPARAKREIDRLFKRIGDEGLQPIVVFDDSDRWLQVAGADAAHGDLVASFFSVLLPWLVEMRCGLVCAVDERYLQDAAWLTACAEGVIETTVTLPTLTAPSQFAAILAKRLVACDIDTDVSALFADEALAALFDMYVASGSGSIRAAITVAQIAVQFAVERNADQVTERHVRAAITATD